MGYSVSDEEFYAFSLLLTKKSDDELRNLLTDTAGAKNDPDKQAYFHYCLIRDEIQRRRRLLVKPEEPEETSDSKYIEATKAANKEAHRIARGYRKNKKPIPYGEIAEEMMKKFFQTEIPRETGKQHRNGEKELTKEWRDKRDSIRGTLRNKMKKRTPE